jgi:hypothetical protein
MLSCRHQTLQVETAKLKRRGASPSPNTIEQSVPNPALKSDFINCSGSLRNVGKINSADDPPTHETLQHLTILA